MAWSDESLKVCIERKGRKRNEADKSLEIKRNTIIGVVQCATDMKKTNCASRTPKFRYVRSVDSRMFHVDLDRKMCDKYTIQ